MTKQRLQVIVELFVEDTPYQVMEVTMNGQRVNLYLKYNTMNDHWVMDIYKDGSPLLTGRKLVLDMDLLGRYNFNLGSIICLHVTSKTTVSEPNRYNLVNGDVRLFMAWEEDVTVD